MEKDEMIMDAEVRNKQIEQYLDNAEAEFDRLLEEGSKKRQRNVIRWSALCGVAVAAGVALLLWLGPQRSTPDVPLTPVQITEGIRQMMLLDIGEIESIVATPMGSYAILTASLTDGSSCSYILKCNDAEGTTTLLAYTNN
jgi:hypothetical protein